MAVVIIGMVDEREAALKIIKHQIEKKGHRTILIDIGTGAGGVVSSLKADVCLKEILRLAGEVTVEEVKSMLATDREKGTALIAEGLKKTLLGLYASGELEGIIAIGGMTGTFLSLMAMNALPFGVPKLMVSSVVAMPAYASWLAEYVWLKDITVMNTVVDTVGMNRLVGAVALNAANAITGMVETVKTLFEERRQSVVITEFAFCDTGAEYVREILEKDYELVSFHSQGIGDKAAIDFANQGLFDGFIDLAPGGFSEYLLGGNRASGPDRLDVAANLLIPYILTPCGFDMISCGPIERKFKNDDLWVSRKLSERKFFLQDAIRVQVRTSSEEMRQIGIAVAERLNRRKYKKMTKFIIPGRGFSSLSVQGGALYDPESDEAFILALKERLDSEIEVLEVDTDINSRQFAETVAHTLKRTAKARGYFTQSHLSGQLLGTNEPQPHMVTWGM
jgi:uncharacterized protein (UPF0261 family)